MKNIIYGLADSRNDLIYYVGKTTIGKKRVLQHLAKSHSPEVNDWKKNLEEDWGYIKAILIEEVESIDDLAERESYWIGIYSQLNPNLLNKKDFPRILEFYTKEDDAQYYHLKSTVFNAGKIIKKRRVALGLNQTELAKASGISRSTLSLIELNNKLSIDCLKKVLLAMTHLEMSKKVVGELTNKRK